MNTRSEERFLRALDALDRRPRRRTSYIFRPDPLPEYAPPPCVDCYVYFIQGGDLIKIGIADSVKHRLSSLQTGSPIPLQVVGSIRFDGRDPAVKAERELHDRFSAHRAFGEWFRDASEIRAYIADYAEGA